MTTIDSSVTATFLREIFAGRTKNNVCLLSMYDPDKRKFPDGYDSSHLPCYIPVSQQTLDEETGLPDGKRKKIFPRVILHQPVSADLTDLLIESKVSNLPNDYRAVFLTLFTTDETGGRKGENTIDPLAIMADYDGGVEPPTDDRLTELGLPLPTVLAKSGGGYHLWWFLKEDSCTKQQRHDVVVAIAAVTGADPAMKDAARVLRLPGSIHLKNPADPKIVTILESNYDRRYTYADFQVFTTKNSPQVKQTATPINKPKRVPTTQTSDFIPPIPLERCLTKEHREILANGLPLGRQDDTGCALARDLIGCASFVPKITFDYCGQNYQLEVAGDPDSLLWDYCQRCSPSIARSDFDRIYKSAYDFNPAPSCDEESLKNCLRSWVKEHTPKKESSGESDSNEVTTDYRAIGQKLGLNISDKGLDKDGSPVSKLLKLKLDLFDLFGKRIRFNEMTREIELDNKPIDLNLAKDFVATSLEYDATTENCIIALNAVAINFKYHPVREYFESLRGKPVDLNSIANFPAKYFGNDDPFQNRLFFRKLIATVGRVMQPGLKDDSLLVLQGKQGTGKSTLLKTLAGDDWFNDDLRSLEDKDEIAKLSRFWIMELAEVDYLFGKKEVELFKRFLSGTEDTFRPPYGRGNITTKRSCGLFATTNKTEFLTDPTGDRRYWVVEVPNDVDTEAIKRDRDLIWATAIAVYERGDRHYLTTDEREAHAVANTNWRDDSDPWNTSILDKLSTVTTKQGSIEYVNVQTIFEKILYIPVERQDKRQRNRVSNCLQAAGFESKSLRVEKKVVKTWLRNIPSFSTPCNLSNPTQKRWVTAEISPLACLYLSNPCNPSFKLSNNGMDNEGEHGNDDKKEPDEKNIIGESDKKMGYMGYLGNEELETALSNGSKCNPSFVEMGYGDKKMGYTLEERNGGESKPVGSTYYPEPVVTKKGLKPQPSTNPPPSTTLHHLSLDREVKIGSKVKRNAIERLGGQSSIPEIHGCEVVSFSRGDWKVVGTDGGIYNVPTHKFQCGEWSLEAS
jgi:predicted P-loop ATPase